MEAVSYTHLGKGRMQLMGPDDLSDKCLALPGCRAIADGDDIDPILPHQAAQLLLRFLHL